MFDIIIIGAGPAGMTAALYAARAKKKIIMLEALTYGGQTVNINKIDNYPVEAHITGFDFATKLYEQVKELGVEIHFEKALEIKNFNDYKEVKTNENTYQGKTIIIATGSSKRKLGLEKEDYFLGKGLSYCATCDGAFYRDKVVAIIGSEENAIEDAYYLADICKKVYLINPKEWKEIPNLKENMELKTNTKIMKLIGEKYLEAIKTDQEEIKVDALFVAIGQVPANEVFKNIIDMDSKGYIIAGEDCHTNIDGIYVAGDGRTKNLRQLVTATADGAVAATEAIKYINS
jgi:thioredoxin reductase (NADPH)